MPIDTKAVDFAIRWTNAFPKPGPNQGVRADAALAAFRRLEPLAKHILGLSVGTKKGSYPGAGYLTGSTITEKDRAEAQVVLVAVSPAGLPMYGRNPVDTTALNVYKAAGQWVLMVATDLALERTLLDSAADVWNALGEAIVELPARLLDAATWPLRATVGQIGIVELAVYGALGIGAAYVVLKALGR